MRAAVAKHNHIYGGQAVIEGVMMRGSHVCAVAMRAPDGSIALETRPLGSIYRSRWARVPFLRGLIVLWDALALGMWALSISANLQAGEDESLEGAPMVLTMVASMVIGLALFFALPAAAGYGLERTLGITSATANLVEGLIRLALFVVYVWAIGRMPEIRRVFGYHGAEHKTIHAFEAGVPLEVESVNSFPREHPRCGTAFLLTVVVFSILLFAALGPMPLATRLMSRILLIPVLAALSYEYIRLSGRLMNKQWAKPLVVPNLLLQRLTTREPEPEMVEVALAAFQAMRRAEDEQAHDPAAHPSP